MIYVHLPRSGEDGMVALLGSCGTRSEVDLANQCGVALIACGRHAPGGVEHAIHIGTN